MKKLLLSITLLATASFSFSQYYYNQVSIGDNPGGLNSDDTEYPNGSGLAAGWTQILSGSNASPAWSPNQTIPFSFDFNGSAVTSYKVSSSGVLTFTTGAAAVPAYGSTALPSASIPDNSVCVLGIQGSGTNDNIMTKTFGSAPNRQTWIFFTSYTKGANWTYWSIVLEETSNRIYIVDQRHAATITGMSLGIQINSSTAYAVAGSPNVSSQAAGDPTDADNVYYEYIPGTRPAYDMSTVSSTVAPYLITGSAPFSITGEVKNLGSSTVTSYDMNYKVNGGATVTANISASIATGATVNFTHPTQWNPGSAGTYSIETWASNINGNADLVPANDKYTYTVEVVDTFAVRKTLMEVFTSSTCGPCAPGNAHLDGTIIPAISNYTTIKYQQNFPGSGDIYQTTESVNRRGFYGVNSIPRMEIDGGWDQNAASMTTGIFNSYQSKPSFVSIDITQASYSGNIATIKADITPLTNLSGNIKYHVVVIEKKTTGNVGSNGETEFFDVMMDMIPNENGNNMTSLSANTNTTVNKTSNLAATNIEEVSDLKVVIFVQDMTTREILQSEWQDIVGNASVTENENELVPFTVSPNPSNGLVTLSYNNKTNEAFSIEVLNMVGQVVYSANENKTGKSSKVMDLSNLPKGTFIVKAKANNIVSTKKLIIQ